MTHLSIKNLSVYDFGLRPEDYDGVEIWIRGFKTDKKVCHDRGTSYLLNPNLPELKLVGIRKSDNPAFKFVGDFAYSSEHCLYRGIPYIGDEAKVYADSFELSEMQDRLTRFISIREDKLKTGKELADYANKLHSAQIEDLQQKYTAMRKENEALKQACEDLESRVIELENPREPEMDSD
jgi:hypothetical protein